MEVWTTDWRWGDGTNCVVDIGAAADNKQGGGGRGDVLKINN